MRARCWISSMTDSPEVTVWPDVTVRPDVAVIIAARNEAGLIGRAVASALRQARAAEIVVVDDGSTDGTAEAAARVDDGSGRLRVLRLPASGGPAAARNHAVAHSTAPYLCPLDADDYMQDGRIQAVFDRAGTEWDLVADDVLSADAAQPLAILGSFGAAGTAARATMTLHRFLEGNVATRNRAQFGFLKPLMRRAFLERHDLRYQEQLRLGEDFMLYLESLAHGARFLAVPACGYVAVRRAHSLSLSHAGRDLENLAAADARLLALPMLDRNERAILRTHRNLLLNRAYHHRMLESKQAGDIPAMLGYLLRRPASTAYILRETARLKLAALGG
jgi:succinoglycan biosynthesis protein ExoU